MRKGRWVVTDRLVGVVLGATLFVVLPAFIVAGAIDCASTKPGLYCSIVQFAFADGTAGHVVPLHQAKSQ
jgi:hypothetical protein